MINNFEQVNDGLAKFIPNNTKPGMYNLDNIVNFMDYLDNPQDKLKVIHIAGTSGKTSTAYFVASLLKQSGKKVGLSVSPHIHSINERYLIDLSTMPEEYFCKQFMIFIEKAEASKLPLTYFEVLVAFAFWEFNNQNVDYAVIEVGLGGLLDCTNVISSPNKISAITDIGIDHVKFLGDTIEAIAKQKAGIIKPFNNVFMNHQSNMVDEIITSTCKQNNSEIHINKNLNTNLRDLVLPEFQIRNFSLAFSVFEYILKRDHLNTIDSQSIINAASIEIPGRMQIETVGKKTVIFDGSHNPQKIQSVVSAIKSKYPKSEVQILAGFKNNTEDIESCLLELKKLSNDIHLTNFVFGKTKHGKAFDINELSSLCTKFKFRNIKLHDDPNIAFKSLLDANNNDIILVTGTFFLLSALDY